MKIARKHAEIARPSELPTPATLSGVNSIARNLHEKLSVRKRGLPL